jgi:hypothetical protein
MRQRVSAANAKTKPKCSCELELRVAAAAAPNSASSFCFDEKHTSFVWRSKPYSLFVRSFVEFADAS